MEMCVQLNIKKPANLSVLQGGAVELSLLARRFYDGEISEPEFREEYAHIVEGARIRKADLDQVIAGARK
jgi:hypothetical protein